MERDARLKQLAVLDKVIFALVGVLGVYAWVEMIYFAIRIDGAEEG